MSHSREVKIQMSVLLLHLKFKELNNWSLSATQFGYKADARVCVLKREQLYHVSGFIQKAQ